MNINKVKIRFSSKKYKSSINNLNFNGIFEPTQTSKELIKLSTKYLKNNQKILDLGCGGGIVSYNLKNNSLEQKFYLSDISLKATKIAAKNLKKKNFNSEIKIGDCFEPWKGYKFNLIINDVSGVSSKVAKLSPWFKNVPFDKSEDGIKLLSKVLKECKNHMTKTSYIFFPIISLSNVTKAKKIMNKYLKIININKIEWPLPIKMYKHQKTLNLLKKRKKIDFETKYNMIDCYTLIVTDKIK